MKFERLTSKTKDVLSWCFKLFSIRTYFIADDENEYKTFFNDEKLE